MGEGRKGSSEKPPAADEVAKRKSAVDVDQTRHLLSQLQPTSTTSKLLFGAHDAFATLHFDSVTQIWTTGCLVLELEGTVFMSETGLF